VTFAVARCRDDRVDVSTNVDEGCSGRDDAFGIAALTVVGREVFDERGL
jgi:hypothetical protein